MNLYNRLIRLLGGYTAAELTEERAEQERLRKTLAHYQDFTKTISVYAGNYPAWKAQMDYRKELVEQGRGLTGKHLAHDHDHPTKSEQVDLYLGKVVDSLDALRGKIPDAVPGHWDSFKITRNEYLQQDAS